MQAEQAVRDGDLGLALRQVKQAVRDNPSEAKYRIFLFQLLAITGDWEKAGDQLKSAGLLDAGSLALSAVYTAAIACERERAAVFAGERLPVLVGEPEPWQAWLIEACKLSGQGRHAEAARLRADAFAQAPATACSVNGQACEWIADADSRLGPVLEMIVNGEYRWVPFDRLRSLVCEAPSDLRDLAWTAATCTWRNGGVTAVLIPTRYFATESSSDHQLLLARRTEWLPLAEPEYRGLGQRQFVTDQGDFALLDIRQITFDCPELH